MAVENARVGAVKLVEDGQPFTGEITDLLPHRDPFLFVKKLTYVSQEKTIGEMSYDPDMWFFKGHFPGRPDGPGSAWHRAVKFVGSYILAVRSMKLVASSTGLIW